MGRPLNKKYFGNRNIGTTGTGDNYGIGGQGLSTISVATAGSFVVTDTYKNFPLLNIGAPNLPTGVQATADVVFELDTVTFSSGGQTDGDYLAGLSTAITGLGGGAVVNIVEVANKVTAVNLTGGNRGEFRRGDFDGTGVVTHQVLQAPNAGTDLQITVTFRVKSITILEKGSGYTAVPALSWSGHTFTGQTTPSGNTPALTTDSGSAGSSTNQENAIIVTAFIPAANGGTAAATGDIVKQTNDKRYKVKTSEGTGICQLVTDGVANAAGEVSIKATDSEGKNYLVAKLTSRKVVLVPAALGGDAGTQFASGASAKWTFGDAVLNDTVKIENA
jgi:hypothetical protein